MLLSLKDISRRKEKDASVRSLLLLLASPFSFCLFPISHEMFMRKVSLATQENLTTKVRFLQSFMKCLENFSYFCASEKQFITHTFQ